MIITDFKKYLDGGTVEICTSEGNYYFDGRMFSETKGKLYLGYPEDDNSNLIVDDKNIIEKIAIGLAYFNNDFYQNDIKNLLENYRTKD